MHLSVERREWVTSDKRVYKAGEKSKRKTRGGKKCPEEEESTKERQEVGGKNPAGGCCHGVKSKQKSGQ